MTHSHGTTQRHEVPEQTVRAGHEADGTDVRKVLMVAGGIVLIVLIAHGVLVLYFGVMKGRAADLQTPPLPMLAGRERAVDLEDWPDDLAHWQNDRVDYAAYLKQKRIHLNSTGYVDAGQSTAHIPIEQAMALYLEQQAERPVGDGTGHGGDAGGDVLAPEAVGPPVRDDAPDVPASPDAMSIATPTDPGDASEQGTPETTGDVPDENAPADGDAGGSVPAATEVDDAS